MGQAEQQRQNAVPVRYKTAGLERVLGNVSPGRDKIFAQRRTGGIAGGQETSAKVSAENT